MRGFGVAALLGMVAACGSSTPSAPSPATAAPATTQATTRIIGVTGNLAFGSVAVGATRSATLTVTNTGNAPIVLTKFVVSPGLETIFNTSGGSTVPANGTLVLTVTFVPKAVRLYNGELSLVGDQTSGNGTVAVNGEGTAAQASPTPTPTPAPTPAPPVPSPSTSTAMHVWGHDPSQARGTYTQYLGFFTCVFCQDFSRDSINNDFGSYGSEFSSTSIRNQFGTWGSQFSTNSACNNIASSPPRVYNASQSTYYGELTLNNIRADAIRDPAIVGWLKGYICAH